MEKKKKKYRLKFMFQEIDLAPGKFVIGRSPSCNLTLEDPLVSRQHVRLLITNQSATIEDLGSRNGTLVNNEPLFDAAPLRHKDRIRVGSHEMIFLEESRFPSRPMRPTGAMLNCPGCRIPITAGTEYCPHCNTAISKGSTCAKCGERVDYGTKTCPSCGTRILSGDTTIPIEIGGASSGWTSGLINEVITKAIAAKRFEHAASLLDGKIEDFDLKAKTGAPDISVLLDISSHNIVIAKELKQKERLEWTVRAWSKSVSPMPKDILESIVSTAEGWCSLKDVLGEYLRVLEANPDEKGEKKIVERLRKLV